MGDDKAGPPAQELAQGLLDQQFGSRVHAGGRFIQDQDAWIGQDGASDGNELSLSLAQVMPSLPDVRIVPLGQAANERVGVGQLPERKPPA